MATKGWDKELGFTVKHQQRKRFEWMKSDLDFTDDVSMLSDQIEQAQELLTEVEESSLSTGLHHIGRKTKVLYNHAADSVKFETRDHTELEVVHSFKCLG